MSSIQEQIIRELRGLYADGFCPQTPHTHDLTYYGFGKNLSCREAIALQACLAILCKDPQWLSNKVDNPWVD